MIFSRQQMFQQFTKCNAKTGLLILAITALFSGCSWMEYFVIINETNFPTTINYNLSESGNGFGMFDNEPSVYALNPSGDIDWSNKLSVMDMDTTRYGISLSLPAKSTLVLGHLMNDHYENHNTVNEQVNLKNLTIVHPEKTLEITSENFADFFKKRNGNIEFRLNSLTLQ